MAIARGLITIGPVVSLSNRFAGSGEISFPGLELVCSASGEDRLLFTAASPLEGVSWCCSPDNEFFSARFAECSFHVRATVVTLEGSLGSKSRGLISVSYHSALRIRRTRLRRAALAILIKSSLDMSKSFLEFALSSSLMEQSVDRCSVLLCRSNRESFSSGPLPSPRQLPRCDVLKYLGRF